MGKGCIAKDSHNQVNENGTHTRPQNHSVHPVKAPSLQFRIGLGQISLVHVEEDDEGDGIHYGLQGNVEVFCLFKLFVDIRNHSSVKEELVNNHHHH